MCASKFELRTTSFEPPSAVLSWLFAVGSYPNKSEQTRTNPNKPEQTRTNPNRNPSPGLQTAARRVLPWPGEVRWGPGSNLEVLVLSARSLLPLKYKVAQEDDPPSGRYELRGSMA